MLLENKMNHYITRNIKDYKRFSIAELPVLSPSEFLRKNQL